MSYLGYKLSRESRALLHKAFPPRYPDVITDHVTTDLIGQRHTAFRPNPAHIEVIGHVDDGKVHAAALRVNGRTHRDDGQPFHVTLSVDRSKKGNPKQSGALVAKGYTKVEPFTIQAHPEYFEERADQLITKELCRATKGNF